MTVSAEALFNDLGVRYEDAFANDPLLCAFIQRIAHKLPTGSKVLDVGCGTGKPVSDLLACAGHLVHGIDASAEMVRVAASQVPGSFHQADMRGYKPPATMDAIFVILSLFQLTPGDITGMMYKFAEWLRVDGVVALGVLPSTALVPQKVVYDPTWDAAWMIGKEWMGGITNEAFFSEEGWVRLLREAGFVLEATPVSYLFSPVGDNHIPEAHYLLWARKVEKQPLLGPFPWPCPSPAEPMRCRDSCGMADVLAEERFVSEALEELLGELDGKTMLRQGPDIGGMNDKTGAVDAVLLPWRLHDMDHVQRTLAEAVRVSRSQVVILQGAPDNEVVRLVNSVARSAPISHQGQLLDCARKYLGQNGFTKISFQRIPAQYAFSEPDAAERCTVAAEFLAGRWHQTHPQHAEIKEILRPRLQLLFQGHEHAIGCDLVALVAKRGPNEGQP